MSHHFTSLTPLPLPLPAADEIGAYVGRVVGNYRLRALVTESPLGGVYRADDNAGNRCWLRVIPAEMSSRAAIQRFAQAWQALAATGDSHFVALREWGEADGQFFVASEDLAGCDIESALGQAGGIHRRKAFELARQLCLGLEVAHAAGIVHGALHPRSLYLVPTANELEVKLLDFGAHALGERHGSLVLLGDPAYLAPEQLIGATTKASDVYALALIVHELLTGKRVRVAETPAQTTSDLLAGRVAAPTAMVDSTLSSLLTRALSPDPTNRPPSVAAFRRALEAWANKNPHVLDEALALAIITAVPKAKLEVGRGAAQPAGVHVSFGSPTMERSNGKTHGTNRLDAAPVGGKPNSGNTPPGAGNDSESVEASLEEFINQANASFPTSDGWDLHTGDVELIDSPSDPDVEDEEDLTDLAVKEPTSVTGVKSVDQRKQAAARASDDLDLDAAPKKAPAGRQTAALGANVTQAAKAIASQPAAATPKATAKATPVAAQPVAAAPVAAAPVAAPAPVVVAPEPVVEPKRPSRAMPAVVVAADPEPAPAPIAAPRKTAKSVPVAAAPFEEPRRPSRSQPIIAPAPVVDDEDDYEDEEEPAPLPPPRRSRQMSADRTEVVSAPLPQHAPMQQPNWTTNPLVLAACMTMAFVVGAFALFLMTRNPPQPQYVVQQPAMQPAPAPAPVAAQPVVTQLPAAQPQPVVTPLPPAQPTEAAPAPAPASDDRAKLAAARAKLAAKSEKPAKRTAPVAAAAPAKKESKKAEPAKKVEAAPAKEEKPAKKESKSSKGGDWVDPFAN